MAYLHADGEGRVCIATTSYANPDASYTFAIQKSREALHAAGYTTRYMLLEGNCHVDDARNTIVAHFLASDCTDLVFIDADVSWEPENLLELLRHDASIVGGVYPYRREDKQDEMPVRMLPSASPGDDGLLEVEGLPTGFMRIRRHVLETLTRDAPTYSHNGLDVPVVFERTLEHGTRWGGDLNFCNRWRATGGRVFAVYNMTLSHSAKVIYSGSLGSFMRRRAEKTLAHVCDKVRNGTETLPDLIEAFDYVGNRWGASVEVLMSAVALARRADGPIIESGSGLSTILMAAATRHTVYCLEHHALHAAKLRQMSAEAGVANIGLCMCDLRDDWYDLSGKDSLPASFALGFNDGPPRGAGDRMKFFDRLDVDDVVCDDADESGYRGRLQEEARRSGRFFELVEPRAAILTRDRLTRKPMPLQAVGV